MVEGLHNQGCEVAILDANVDTELIARSMQSNGGDIHGIVCNLADPEQLKNGFDTAVSRLGGDVDILLNNAGVNLRKSLETCTVDDWNYVFSVNSTAPFLLTKYASTIMKKKKYGKIINIASMLSFLGAVSNGSYAATKGSILLQTRSFSNDLAPYGICVNAIAPGYFKTELNSPDRMKNLGDDFLKSIDLRIPAGRWGDPTDLQGAVIFLASSASDYVTGVCINVDGGYLSR